jgi:hypothetical protein
VMAVLLMGACSRPVEKPVDYTKVPRVPDDRGEVTQIDFVQIQLDGKRKYGIRKDVQSFVTYNGKVTPLLSWKGKYVHIGLDDERNAIWVAGIGVVDRASTPPSVFYTNGEFVRMRAQRLAVFKDGTVLELTEGLTPPPKNSKVTAKIDVSKDVVAEFAPTRDA